MRNNIKKTIAFALTLCAVSAGVLTPNAGKCALSPTPIVANAADTYVKQFKSGSITYKVYKNSSGSQYAVVSGANSNINNVTLGANIYNGGTYYPITQIAPNAFNGCNVGKLDLSNATNLSLIGEGAFRYSGVTSVTIGSSMKIDEYAFADTSSLESVILSTQAANVNIFCYAFNNSGLREFYGNSSIIYLQREAFRYCRSLSTVRFSSRVDTLFLGENLFYLLYNLKEVTIGGANTKVTLSKETFSSSGIESLYLPDTVKTIPESCFKMCYFKSFRLPDSVTEIGPEAFSCATLPSNFYIGKKLWKISGSAFDRTCGIKSFTVNSSNTYFKSENGVLYSKNGKTLVCYPSEKTGDTLTTYATNIPNGAISNNKYLKKLNLVKFSRTSTNSADFLGLDNLEYLTLPSSEYSRDGNDIIKRFKTLFATTKLHNVNGRELVEVPSDGSEPRFNDKFRNAIENSFEQFGNTPFMVDYVDKMADYVVRNYTRSSMTDIEKILHLRKWIINRVDYDFETIDSKKNHVDGSVFLHKKEDGKYYTVCDGYARCFELLLTKAGIECKSVIDPKQEVENGGHAWNIVKLNGKWYHADVTWDDGNYQNPSLLNRYDNFLAPDAQFDNDGHGTFNWQVFGNAAIRKSDRLAYMDNRKMGDLYDDGVFNSADVSKLRSYIGTSNNSYIAIGDLDFDGKITSTDADLLQQYIDNDWKYYPNVRVWRLYYYENTPLK